MKKKLRLKLLAFVMAMVMLLGCLPLSILAADARGSVNIIYKGEIATDVTLVEGSRIKLESMVALPGSLRYQWQVLADKETDLWVGITNRSGDTCTVSYAMVKSILDENDTAQLRLSVRQASSETTYYSEPVTIHMLYLVDINGANQSTGTVNPNLNVTDGDETPDGGAVANYVMKRSAGGIAVLAADDGVNAIADDDITYTILINYHLEDGTEVAAQRKITWQKGERFSYSFELSTLVGYEPMIKKGEPVEGVTVTKNDSGKYYVNFLIEDGQEDLTVNVVWYPIEVNYTVKHMIQHVSGSSEYIEDVALRETRRGYTGSLVSDGLARNDHGLISLDYDRERIAPDGSTVVEIRYDREYMLVLFDLGSGGFGQDPIYTPYGTEIYLNYPERSGYVFEGWELMERDNAQVTDTTIKSAYAVSPDQTAGEVNAKMITVDYPLYYAANWGSTPTKYTVVYWRENANDTKYSYWGKREVTQNVISGMIVSGADDIPTSIASATEKQYFTYNAAKTDKNKVIEGSGTTVINVYYERNVYEVEFQAKTPASGSCYIPEHTHGEGCVYPTLNCPHIHTAACSDGNQSCGVPEHSHSESGCFYDCGITEHEHQPSCYGAQCEATKHVHTVQCYDQGGAVKFGAGSQSVKGSNNTIYADNYEDGKVVQLQTSTNDGGCGQSTPVYSYYMAFDGNLYEITSVTNGSPADVYSGYNPLTTNNNSCLAFTHQHTDKCTDCGMAVHSHSEACYNCGMIDHVHSEVCDCSHIHDQSCYDTTYCTLVEHTHSDDGYNDRTVYKIVAKYEANIGAVWPTYDIMKSLGCHRESAGNNANYFYAWTSILNSGTAVSKRPTLTSELITNSPAVAGYSNTEPRYPFFYLLESTNQEGITGNSSTPTIEVPFSTETGKGTVIRNGIRYESDPSLYQLMASSDLGAKDMTGFENVPYSTSSNGNKYFTSDNNRYFLYNRITPSNMSLDLVNADEVQVTYTATTSPKYMSFGMPLNRIVDPMYYDPNDPDYREPDYPDIYEEGAYSFTGWYTTPECFPGSEVDWDTAVMPEGSLSIYAGWEPVKYKVWTYKTDPSVTENSEWMDVIEKIPHGTTISYNEKPTREPYTFAGWFYKPADESGNVIAGSEEKAFSFNNSLVKDNLVIYAKWRSDVKLGYEITYVWVNDEGEEIEIAEPTRGTAIAGGTRTIEAKVGTDLYADYQVDYYPEMSAISVDLDIEDADPDTLTVYGTIYYQYDPNVTYTVRYLDAETGDPMPGYENVLPKEPGHYAVVTEVFKVIPGYMPDAYSKTLVLTNDDEKNVITFYYTKDIVNAYYEISHQYENVDGSYSVVESMQDSGEIGTQTFADRFLTGIAGFEAYQVELYVGGVYKGTLSPSDAGTYSSEITAEGTQLIFKYNRLTFGYKVDHVDNTTGDPICDIVTGEPIVDQGTAKYGAIIDVSAKDFSARGYQLLNNTTPNRVIEIKANEDDNVETFRYMENQVTVVYEMVGVGGTLSNNNETLGVVNAVPFGATPRATTGYHFVGWFKDAECTQPVESGVDAILDANNKLTPIKHLTADGFELFQNETFYAKFQPSVATLVIDIAEGSGITVDEGDSFIFHVVGTDNNTNHISVDVVVNAASQRVVVQVPVGAYTVTQVTDWAWRYTPDATAKNVDVAPVTGGTVTFTQTAKNEQWLSGDDYHRVVIPVN